MYEVLEMKWIVYNFITTMRVLENEEVVDKEIIGTAKTEYSEEKLEYVKSIALNGEYAIEDDGQPAAQPTDAERIAELEEALAMLLSGVTE
jgi:hypothetical protein